MCKDQEFARNLIAQMKSGIGRHNSSLQFRQNTIRESLYQITGLRAVNGLIIANNLDVCEIGQVVAVANCEYSFPPNEQYIRHLVPKDNPLPDYFLEPNNNFTIASPFNIRIYEKTQDINGGLWWKRIE